MDEIALYLNNNGYGVLGYIYFVVPMMNPCVNRLDMAINMLEEFNRLPQGIFEQKCLKFRALNGALHRFFIWECMQMVFSSIHKII